MNAQQNTTSGRTRAKATCRSSAEVPVSYPPVLEHLGPVVPTFLTRIKVGWLIVGITLFLCAAIEGASWVALHVKLAVTSDPRIHADAYGDATWVADYYREFEASYRTRWEPYVYWRRPAFKGRYINVGGDGLRVTPQTAAEPGKPPLTVFLFGGSAMWGTGARDTFTIPALLGLRLHDRGVSARVVNFAESGYVSSQEMLALLMELRRGNRPDVAVFYDGVNDAFSAYQQRVAGRPQNEDHRVAEFNLTQEDHLYQFTRAFLGTAASTSATARVLRGVSERLGLTPAPTLPPVHAGDAGEALTSDVGRVYWQNVNLIADLCTRLGIRTLFYWQPTSFEGKRLTAYEAIDRDTWQEFGRFFVKVSRHVREQAAASPQSAAFRDLTTTFADRSSPVFVDFAHVGEDGNAVIAATIAEDVTRVSASAVR